MSQTNTRRRTPKVPADAPLNPAEVKFVEEYLKHGNRKRAYMAAYPDAKEMSAAATSSVKVKQLNVARTIKEKLEAAAKRLDVTADRVTAELARIAFLDPRLFFHPDGALKHIRDLSEDEAATIASFDVEDSKKVSQDGDGPTYVKRVRVWSKLDALKILAQVTKVIAEDDQTKEPAKPVIAPQDISLGDWVEQQPKGKPN
jgi:phage terminase small subunit